MLIKVRIWQKGDTLKDVLYHTISPLEQGVTASTLIIYSGDRVDLYTGLKDKNGAEIYKGDIILQNSESYKIAGVVDLSEDLRWCVGNHYIPCKPTYNKYRKILGNIYENPEFLKESL